MKPYRTLSLTARLALLFAGVTVVTFAAVGTYLYEALAHQLNRRDDAELIGKIDLVRHLLLEVDSIAAIEQNSHPFKDAVFGHDGLILRLIDPASRTLILTAEPSRSLPAGQPVPAAREPADGDVQDWQSAAGTGRMLAAIGTVSNAARTPVLVTVAREGAKRGVGLREYGRSLFVAVCIGALLAAAMGFIIVRLGMRPLRFVIGKANDISTHRLNTRLAVDAAPTELRELSAAFNAMLDRLEDGVQRLSRFAADLAHDLRTPINTLMVETQVALARLRSAEEYQALMASNIEEYERLARMIENTLFLARADNAQLALQRETLSINKEFARIRDYFEGLAEEAQVTLSICGDDAQVSADPVLFQRAVSNLVSNAIGHTPPGGAIRLGARSTPGNLEISVENSGPGISSAHLPHLFERYYRADVARSASHHSAGLGLAIVRAIMHLHGGEVTVSSTVNQSTIFLLRFGDPTDEPRSRDKRSSAGRP